MTALQTDCIDACLECLKDCENCLHEMIGKETDNDCPWCCRECVDICGLCARAMARDRKYASKYCGNWKRRFCGSPVG